MKKINKKEIFKTLRDIQLSITILPSTAEFSFSLIKKAVEKDAIVTWEELGLDKNSLKRLVKEKKRNYYFEALKAIRQISLLPYSVKAAVQEIKNGIKKKEISWKDLRITEKELDKLIKEYDIQWKNKLKQ